MDRVELALGIALFKHQVLVHPLDQPLARRSLVARLVVLGVLTHELQAIKGAVATLHMGRPTLHSRYCILVGYYIFHEVVMEL